MDGRQIEAVEALLQEAGVPNLAASCPKGSVWQSVVTPISLLGTASESRRDEELLDVVCTRKDAAEYRTGLAVVIRQIARVIGKG